MKDGKINGKILVVLKAFGTPIYKEHMTILVVSESYPSSAKEFLGLLNTVVCNIHG